MIAVSPAVTSATLDGSGTGEKSACHPLLWVISSTSGLL
jgi:hypothetical protein